MVMVMMGHLNIGELKNLKKFKIILDHKMLITIIEINFHIP